MFTTVLKFLIIAIEVLLIFNLIIVVHELGHFLAAKWRGLIIEGFGVWFGKPLWQRKIGGVTYSLGSIPAGGFVKLPQLANGAIEGELENAPESLPPLKPLDKIIVAFAGPLFSFLLALGMATVVWQVGKPTSDIENSTTIGFMEKDGPADKAGLKIGDEILEVDGHKVTKFGGPLNSVTWAIVSSEGEKIAFKVRRGNEVLTINSGWTKEATDGWRRKSLRKVLIGPVIKPWIGAIVKKSPAEKAGLKIGDLVTAANGTPITTLHELDDIIEKNPTQTLALGIKRGSETLQLSLTPEARPNAKSADDIELGIAWGKIDLAHPSPWSQVVDSVLSIRNMITALFSSKSDVKVQHFSGPVGIMNVYAQMFQSEQGWRMALAFSVFFNVNLALLNMLPFPVLDGGHITLALLEVVRRKPVNQRALEWLQTACVLAVVGFMLYVSFFDVGDLFSGKKMRATPAPAAQPAPK
jgi:regulator of sigma E protease